MAKISLENYWFWNRWIYTKLINKKLHMVSRGYFFHIFWDVMFVSTFRKYLGGDHSDGVSLMTSGGMTLHPKVQKLASAVMSRP